jgi:Raf kinase inhibitor-like YbhB/YbcL family protein
LVIYDLTTNTKNLDEGIPKNKILSNGARQGINDFGKIGYDGPCPPSGIHRYFFKVYALDTKINLENLNKEQILKAMNNHIIAQGQLIGKYSRK